MKMKIILENWNKFLLKENNNDLNPKIKEIFYKLEDYIKKQRILKNDNNIFVEIEYKEINKSDENNLCYIAFKSNILKGKIVFEKLNVYSKEGYGNGCYMIGETYEVVPRGFGPLLYELILEKVGEKNNYLTCDRYEVSTDAQRVWNIYNQRPDIEKMQLDILDKNILKDWPSKNFKQITPDFEDDDIDQSMAIFDVQSKNNNMNNLDWTNSAFSKAYKKNNQSLTNLIKSSEFIKFSYQEIEEENEKLFYNSYKKII